MSKARNWGRVVLLVAGLSLVGAAGAATADYYGPPFAVDDCACGQGDYDRQDGSSGGAGYLICDYHLERAGADLFQNWKAVYLNYNPTVDEAIDRLRPFLTDEHLSRYLQKPPGEVWEVQLGLPERTDRSLYGYMVTIYPPDTEFSGEYGQYTGRPPHYYLERRFVYQTYDVTIFVNGELFADLADAEAQMAELEQCVRDLIDSRPAATPTPSGDYLLSGTVTDWEGNPLHHAQMELDFRGDFWRTTTNAGGYYEFPFDENYLTSGDTAEIVVRLNYERDGTVYFRILDDATPVEFRRTIQVHGLPDLTQDLELADDPPASNTFVFPDPAYLSDLSTIYRHMTEALEFYLDRLSTEVDYDPPVDVRAFSSHKYGTCYSNADSTIYIHWRDAGIDSPNRPMNREWHEFSHHVMYSLYHRWPGSFLGRRVNHGGYTNSDTGDSYLEGFAELMPLLMAEYYGYPEPELYAGFGSLELNYKAWEMEEFAVAGALWDLMDERDEESDRLDLTTDDVWWVLTDFQLDFKALYDALSHRFPNYQDEIDAVFRAHGFFVDAQPPYHAWSEGEEIGRAADAARPERRSAGRIPGQFVRVDNAVPYFLVEVAFPGHPEYDYRLRTENQDGLVYVQIPPEEYQATITVAGEGVQTGSPLTFGTEEYWAVAADAAGRGYYREHDFEISGAVPPGPQPRGAPETADSLPHWLSGGTEPAGTPATLDVPAEPDLASAGRRRAIALGALVLIGLSVICLGGAAIAAVLVLAKRRG